MRTDDREPERRDLQSRDPSEVELSRHADPIAGNLSEEPSASGLGFSKPSLAEPSLAEPSLAEIAQQISEMESQLEEDHEDDDSGQGEAVVEIAVPRGREGSVRPTAADSPNEPRPDELQAGGPSEADRNELGTQSLLLSTFLSLAIVLVLLGVVRLFLPQMLEACRYALTRGQLRAEYELSGAQLSQVSVEGLGKVSQMVGQRVGPSVVHIDMRRAVASADRSSDDFHGRFSGLDTLRVDQGSGVIIDTEGHIVTNHHVVEDGGIVEVHLSDGRVVEGVVKGVDAVTDLAVLKIEAKDLMPITWGDSDAMSVGMPVWAVGSPFGLMGTVTFGILSGKHRIDLSSARSLGNVKGKAEYSDLMQSDVAVNPGNSGGALVNAQGGLIGINTAIIGQSYRGISFAIPSNVVRKVCDKILSTGKMERGMLGLIVDELYQPRREGKGIVGTKILRLVDDGNSPAREAGLQPGDVISAIDGQSIGSIGDLRRIVGEAYVGGRVKVTYWRDETDHQVDVEVAPIPSSLVR